MDVVHLRPEDRIGEIAPEIYGHFIEHIGRCIYDGIWLEAGVGDGEGIRQDVVDLLSDLNPPVIRWPGGCFADDYHWEDGVGPREERPRRRNLWWGQNQGTTSEESNAFGTEEFLAFCRQIGAEPYLAVNVGSSDPREATDWAEYCNYDGDTELTRRRAENGHPGPHEVTYWGVGNENWGCGGRFAPDTYAEEYRRFATFLGAFDRRMGDGSMELIACGHTAEGWNRTFLEALDAPRALDHLSVHRYYHAGHETEFSEEQYYRLLSRSLQVEADVEQAASAVDVVAPGTDIGVIVDEWGVWHPGAEGSEGNEQANTVRDAVSAAGVLDGFNRHADVVTMTNVAQTINVLQCLVQTTPEHAWPTPTYQVFDLYRPHMGATALRAVVDTGVRAVEDEDHDVPYVSASASERDDGAYVTLSNRGFDRERTVRIDAGEPIEGAEARVLFDGQGPREHSTRENAAAFAAEDAAVDVEGDAAVVDAPPASVLGVELRRA